MKKITLFFCAIILASVAALPNKVADDNFIDDVKKIVHTIEGLIDELFTTGPNFIGTFADKYHWYLTKVLNYTRTAITRALEALEPILNQIAAQSTDSVKKLISCIEEQENGIMALRVNFVAGVGKCIKDDLVALVKTVAPLLKDLSGIHEEAKKAANEIDQCQGTDQQALLCVVQVISDILKVATKVPDAVKNDFQPVVDAANAFAVSGKQCVASQVDPFCTSAGKLLNKVIICATS
ncbi:uncharacterized protein LOC126887307 [Diabrotica virgifera virgifera]|uniref:Uncharacterized protein LOC114341027 n=1 Tax=Diabrotica virgifera virgifera TaxID=50390 RepID=A0A6P7GNN5_DIAVI|nr:uncharacterized protein LOC126887307 [Diabrotica virgifera virgifera]